MSVSEEWNAGLKKKKLPIGALPWELLAESVMRSSLEFGPAPNQSLGISVLFIFPGQPALLVTAFTWHSEVQRYRLSLCPPLPSSCIESRWWRVLMCTWDVCLGFALACVSAVHRNHARQASLPPPCNLMSIYYGEERRGLLDRCICLQFPNGTWQRSLAVG